MKDINYTIIIPHKNIPDLLRRCLASIPRREDIQIIVVDDNSDPEKVDFDHFPGVGEPCVEVYFTKEGKGAGYARNVGLKYAKGKWIIFADADDFFNPHLLANIDKYKCSSFDIIYWSINSVFSDTLKPTDRGMQINAYIKAASEGDLKSADFIKYTFLYPSAKMIKRKLIEDNRIRFDEVPASNDTMFSVKAAALAKYIYFETSKIYCLTRREGSIVGTLTYKNLHSRLVVSFDLYNFLSSVGKEEYAQSSVSHWSQIRHCSYIKLIKDFFLLIKCLPPKAVVYQFKKSFFRKLL